MATPIRLRGRLPMAVPIRLPGRHHRHPTAADRTVCPTARRNVVPTLYDRGMSTRIAFLKGHGTENDFVIVPDPENAIDLPPAAVAALCDRRAGIGGDGVLHVVRSAAHPEAREMAAEAEWFMDYRNGDGSVAEMCGNGVRVFARYLQRAGHVTEGDLAVATRGGVKTVHIAKDGDVTVGMGKAFLPEGDVTVSVGERSWPARNVNMGNPHAVAFVDDLAHAGDLLAPPPFSPPTAYPQRLR